MNNTKISLESFEDILHAIQNKNIDYGINKDFCFVISEDGNLVFLRRKRGHEKYQEFASTYEEEHWPCNEYDGEEILNMSTGDNRGIDITEKFLDFLNITYQG